MHGTDGSGPGGPAGKSRLFRPAMAEPVLAPAVVQLSPGDLCPSHRAVSRDAAQGSADPAPALGLSADQQADGRGHGRVPLHSREHVWRSRVLGEAHRHRRWACPRLAHGSGAWEPERRPRPRGERGAAGGPRGTGDVGSTVASPPRPLTAPLGRAPRSREAGPLLRPPWCVQLPSRLSPSLPSLLPTTVGFRKKRKRNQEPQEGRWQGHLGGGLLSLVRTPRTPQRSSPVHRGPALLSPLPTAPRLLREGAGPSAAHPGWGLTPVPFADLKQDLMDLRMMLKKR